MIRSHHGNFTLPGIPFTKEHLLSVCATFDSLSGLSFKNSIYENIRTKIEVECAYRICEKEI